MQEFKLKKGNQYYGIDDNNNVIVQATAYIFKDEIEDVEIPNTERFKANRRFADHPQKYYCFTGDSAKVIANVSLSEGIGATLEIEFPEHNEQNGFFDFMTCIISFGQEKRGFVVHVSVINGNAPQDY